MKKIFLLFLIIFALFLTGCWQKDNNVYCETLTSVECMKEKNCELCGKSIASSFISCHSKKFCEEIFPVDGQDTPPLENQKEDDQNQNNGNLAPELEKIFPSTTTEATTTAKIINSENADDDNEDTQNLIQKLGIDDFVKKMVQNETLRNYLRNECLEGEIRCPDGIYYQWTKINDAYTIAFVSFNAEQKYKDDPFECSREIYKVNLKTGDVQRQNQHDGSFEFEVNLYQE